MSFPPPRVFQNARRNSLDIVLQRCTSSLEGYSASVPSAAQEHWKPAIRLSGNDHDRTFTGKQTVTFKAHHALVGRGRGVATRATLDQHAYPILPPVPLHTNIVFPALPPPFVLSGGNLL